jgi:hypothetical protein
VSDPLGLTPDQRTRSNMFAVFQRRELWWPPDVEQAIERPEPAACGYCRAISGHTPDCIGQLAETLHDLELRLGQEDA